MNEKKITVKNIYMSAAFIMLLQKELMMKDTPKLSSYPSCSLHRTPPRCHLTLHAVCAEHLLSSLGLHIGTYKTHSMMFHHIWFSSHITWTLLRLISHFCTKKSSCQCLICYEIMICVGNSGMLAWLKDTNILNECSSVMHLEHLSPFLWNVGFC
jgi:hypothetical protein